MITRCRLDGTMKTQRISERDIKIHRTDSEGEIMLVIYKPNNEAKQLLAYIRFEYGPASHTSPWSPAVSAIPSTLSPPKPR